MYHATFEMLTQMFTACHAQVIRVAQCINIIYITGKNVMDHAFHTSHTQTNTNTVCSIQHNHFVKQNIDSDVHKLSSCNTYRTEVPI